jgi:hypothetical protein
MNNAAVIAVDQNSTNNRQITGGTLQVWAADIPGSTDKYVALFNRSSAASNVSVALNVFGATSATATDLWSGAGQGSFTTTFTRFIPSHGAGLYRLVLSGSSPTATPPPASTYYTLTARNSNKLLDVYNSSTADGGNVIQWTANGGANQQWQFNLVGSSTYTIVNRNSGKCLDVYNNSTADGGNVDQWTCNGQTNQQWQMVAHGSYFLFKSVKSGKCLDVAGVSNADGANIDQWTCNNGTNQDWTRQ